MRPHLIVAAASLLAAAASADTKLNTTEKARSPAVIGGPNDELIVIFVGEDVTSEVQLVRVDPQGVVVYGPVAVQYDTGVGAAFGGAFAWSGARIGWAYQRSVANGSEIRFHTLDADGLLRSPSVLVSASVPPTDRPCCPDIVWAEAEFLVGYESRWDVTYGQKAVTLRRISASGALASPELFAYDIGSAPGGLTEVNVGRVGNVLQAGWYGGATGPFIESVWLDLSGNVLVPLTVLAQASAGEALLFAGIGSRSDRTIVYFSEFVMASQFERPLQQMHLAPDGAVLLGPQQIGESSQPIFGNQPIVAPEGHGIAWRHLGNGDTKMQIYVRRISSDGLLGADSVRGSNAGAVSAMYGIQTIAYQDRVYGLAWQDSREDPLNPFTPTDVFFNVVPGYELIVAGAGPSPGAAPQVKLYQPEQVPGSPAVTFQAYGASGHGCNVGSGDMDGNEDDEVLTGPGPGPNYGPQVKAFTWKGVPKPKVNFYAYGTLRYGAKVGGARLDGDAYHEILTTPGPGEVFGPHVRGFDFDNAQVRAIPKVSFFAYGTLKYGANGADGDVDRDGYGEILTGPGPGAVFGSHLRGFEYDGASISSMAKINAIVFAGSQYGLHVAGGDTEWDGYDEIGTGPGPMPGMTTTVAVYDYDAATLTPKTPRWDAFPGAGGVRVSFCQWSDPDPHREVLVSRGPLASSSAEIAVYDDASVSFLGPLGVVDPYPGQTHGSTLSSVFVGY